MTQVQTAWFRNKLAEKCMSQNDLAKRIGMDRASLSCTLRGLRQAKLQDLAAIADALCVPRADVLEKFGMDVSGDTLVTPAMLRITGWIAPDNTVHQYGENHVRTTPRPADVPHNATALRWQSGTEFDGAVLFFVRENAVSVAPREVLGRLAIGENEDGTLVLLNGSDKELRKIVRAWPVLWVKM